MCICIYITYGWLSASIWMRSFFRCCFFKRAGGGIGRRIKWWWKQDTEKCRSSTVHVFLCFSCHEHCRGAEFLEGKIRYVLLKKRTRWCKWWISSPQKVRLQPKKSSPKWEGKNIIFQNLHFWVQDVNLQRWSSFFLRRPSNPKQKPYNDG